MDIVNILFFIQFLRSPANSSRFKEKKRHKHTHTQQTDKNECVKVWKNVKQTSETRNENTHWISAFFLDLLADLTEHICSVSILAQFDETNEKAKRMEWETFSAFTWCLCVLMWPVSSFLWEIQWIEWEIYLL